MRCLVVDDEQLIATVLQTHLERCGHDVTVAGDGRAAYDLWHSVGPRFDLVISDVKLPGMSGIELVAAIRECGDTVPCLLISGHVSAQLLDEALDLEPLAVLAKPFSFSDLDAKIVELSAD